MTTRRDDVLAELRSLTSDDAPTHGGRVLSYVYDAGLPDLDVLAHDAAGVVQWVNALDPTTFPSVARLERDLVEFARALFHGDGDVVGSVTSGGTESCLLAVKTARDLWRRNGGEGRARVVAPVSVHAAFHKAAHLFDCELELVPVDPESGAVRAADVLERLDAGVALVVLSAPSYPHAALDPIAELAPRVAERGIACHVDACIGGFALPWWPDVAPWDFRVPGVTSISADLHKFGYAPKGASVLMHRGRDRHRAQYFATTRWPGYPVVNPTLLGSKPAGPLAASWAITRLLGVEGYRALIERTRAATESLRAVVDSIEGLGVVGAPTGPLFAVASDASLEPERRVDPHLFADAVRRHGFVLQQQPGIAQGDGTRLPRTTHLTVTPVTADVVDGLTDAMRRAADEVRGQPPVDATSLASALAQMDEAEALAALGIDASGALPDEQATITALIEVLPNAQAEGMLVAVLASLVDPENSPH